MQIKVKVYSGAKYLPGVETVAEVELDNAKWFNVRRIENDEIYKLGFDMVDENREYCEIFLEDGSRSLFRNSHVDIFKVF